MPDFVRYRPDIETIDPHIDELLEEIIEFWEKKGRESPKTEGGGRALRGAHSKPFGVARAEIEILHSTQALDRGESGHERCVQVPSASQRGLDGRIAIATVVQGALSVDVPTGMYMRIDQAGKQRRRSELIRRGSPPRADGGLDFVDAPATDRNQHVTKLLASSVDQ